LDVENYSGLFLKMLMESDPIVRFYIINFNVKGAKLASIICEMTEFLDRIFWSKKDKLLRKQKLDFESYRKMLIRNKMILKKQNLEREVSDIRRIGFNFEVDKKALKQEYGILMEKLIIPLILVC
jgi:hypothetical protein